MIVMPSNNSKAEVHFWQGKYGGLAHLYSVGGQRGPYKHLPYALDNGAYSAFLKEEAFDWEKFNALVAWAMSKDTPPLWIVCPDVVGDAAATVELWNAKAPSLQAATGWPLAFACQDGMTLDTLKDLNPSPSVLFIGGSTDWKWESLEMWMQSGLRVHVGRVNSPRRLYECYHLGVESVDGTGWFRGNPRQTEGLRRFLELQSLGAVEDFESAQ